MGQRGPPGAGSKEPAHLGGHDVYAQRVCAPMTLEVPPTAETGAALRPFCPKCGAGHCR